jgi:acetyl-CoA C-acetyltransferase
MSDRVDAVILGACRTPIGKFQGAFKGLSAVDLGAVVMREAIARSGVSTAQIGDVVMGCVLQAGVGMNISRQAAIKAGLPVNVPGQTINRVCGSGLQAVINAVEAISVGYSDAILAGGTESMSNAPYLLRGARTGYSLGNGEATDSILSDGLTCAMELCHMGSTAEEVSRRYNISRADQDAYACESQRRAGHALNNGYFKEEIVSVPVPQRDKDSLIVETDEHLRPSTTVATLATLKPAFEPQGSVTAGNAAGINDGAAAMIVTSSTNAKRNGLKPLARVVSYAVTGVEPRIMGMGPVVAVRQALERAKLTVRDVDLFELNEAFAAQVIAVARVLQVDPATVNVNGGAIALGHPIGASGARVLTTLVHALRAGKHRYGVAALCIGGGMGIAMVVENLTG